ncbi:MAG: helix-turn-helix domain-containing protein [Leptospiraceae bacterium]|nr:helix-turn-helix domain-containing protein [Leptospiraceae bacterium]
MHEERLKEKIYSVRNFLEKKLVETIDLNSLAFEANYTQFHFTRFFSEQTGETPINYLRRLRLEKAAFDLKTTDRSVIDIALDSGYDAHESFTRAFKKQFKLSPKEYRNQYHYKNSKEIMEPKFILTDQIKLVTLKNFTIRFQRFTGNYEDCPGPYKDSVLWKDFLKEHDAKPNEIVCGICHDDPEITEGSKVRFDLGILSNSDSKLYNVKTIEGGRFALATHIGDYANLGESYEYMLYSYPRIFGKKIRNKPLLEIYQNPFPEKIEEARTEIFIPIEE